MSQTGQSSRFADLLWCGGLFWAVLGAFISGAASAGWPALAFGLLALALALLSLPFAFRLGRKSLPGALLTVGVAAFVVSLGFRRELILLAQAPRYVAASAAVESSKPAGTESVVASTDASPPPSTSAVSPFGSAEPSPSAFTLRIFQPMPASAPSTWGTATPNTTLYAPRLDATNVPVAEAFPGVQQDAPFGLLATAAIRIDTPGSYHFSAGSDGTVRLWVDDVLVEPKSPVELSAGVHSIRLQYEHPAGARLSLGVSVGTSPGALGVLDMSRLAIAEVVKDGQGGSRLILPEAILFERNQDALGPSAERALSALDELMLRPAPGATLSVEGHTDDLGSDAHNLQLSRRRAERVRAWLVQRGRHETMVSIEAFGETRPRVPNDSDRNRQANRRVELVLESTQP